MPRELAELSLSKEGEKVVAGQAGVMKRTNEVSGKEDTRDESGPRGVTAKLSSVHRSSCFGVYQPCMRKEVEL